jgi:hypothetical protein
MGTNHPLLKLYDKWQDRATKDKIVFKPVPRNEANISHIAEGLIYVMEPEPDTLRRMSSNEFRLKKWQEIIYDVETQAMELAKDIKIPPDLAPTVLLTLNEFLEKVRSGQPKFMPYFPKLPAPGVYNDADKAVLIRLVFIIHTYESGATPGFHWYISAEAVKTGGKDGELFVVDRVIENSYE